MVPWKWILQQALSFFLAFCIIDGARHLFKHQSTNGILCVLTLSIFIKIVSTPVNAKSVCPCVATITTGLRRAFFFKTAHWAHEVEIKEAAF